MTFGNMNSGYDGYSMSLRAAEAYEDGEMPISEWSKKEIIYRVEDILGEDNPLLPLIRKKRKDTLQLYLLECSSWHHTSMYANETNFYSIKEDYVANLTEEMIETWKDCKPEKPKSDIFRGQITYLEWSGTRNHRRCKEILLKDVMIEKRGCFYYILDEKGRCILKKKKDSNGTYVRRYDEEMLEK